ncbi:MAG: type 4a pilus biogenesis protein PilO [Desulfobacterales bacterium]|nr:type 4a pilus biogenesis protein PilO [Desulfobacterales bacterium]
MEKSVHLANSLARREAKLAEVRVEYNYLLDKLDVENTGAHTLVEVINEIKNFSARIGVTIDQIRPMGIKDMGVHQEMPFEIALHCNSESFKKFVYYLETSPQILAISNVVINREEEGISARLTVSKISLENVVAGSTEQRSASIRIGMEFWPGYAPFYIAEHKGWLSRENMSVKLVHGTDGDKLIRLLETKDLDGICISLGSFIENLEKGLDLKVVYPLVWTKGAEAVVAGVHSNIFTMADLKDKTVHLSSRMSQYLLFRAMELNKMNFNDVGIETLNSRMISQSLTTGMIDAGVLWDPYLSQLTREKKGRIIFSSADIPGEIIENLVVDSTVMGDSRKDVVIFLLEVIQRACDWMRIHPEEAIQITAKRLNMTMDATRKGLQKIHFPSVQEVQNLVGISGGTNQMDIFISLQEKFLSGLYGKKVIIPRHLLTDWSMAVKVMEKQNPHPESEDK